MRNFFFFSMQSSSCAITICWEVRPFPSLNDFGSFVANQLTLLSVGLLLNSVLSVDLWMSLITPVSHLGRLRRDQPLRSNESSRKQARVILRQREKEIGQSGAKNLTRMIRNWPYEPHRKGYMCVHFTYIKDQRCAQPGHSRRETWI